MSDLQSSIALDSSFGGASPQMIGDFGGGSLIKAVGGASVLTPNTNLTTFSAPLAGGSRRIKVSENNQVSPMDRYYATFNYFRNSYQAIGTGPNPGPPTVVDSESLAQYTVGFEKTFFHKLFSIDVRMPFTSGVDQGLLNAQGPGLPSGFAFQTGHMGNLSTTLKSHLLQLDQTSISGGLGISLPTGSSVDVQSAYVVDANTTIINNGTIVNRALHLMPFLGAYRPLGKSSWLQAFTQIDVPVNRNDFNFAQVEINPVTLVVANADFFRNRFREQTLLYADVSLGKWWFRQQGNGSRRTVTGVASLLELHYTGSLNDADATLGSGNLGFAISNRFDVLNLTTGLLVEFNNQWRINLSGVFPLRERQFDAGGRREDRFFDGEFVLQMNRIF